MKATGNICEIHKYLIFLPQNPGEIGMTGMLGSITWLQWHINSLFCILYLIFKSCSMFVFMYSSISSCVWHLNIYTANNRMTISMTTMKLLCSFKMTAKTKTKQQTNSVSCFNEWNTEEKKINFISTQEINYFLF